MRYFINPRYLFVLSVILATLLVAGCGTALPTVKPFKLDIQQGNVVTSKMLLQLRPGMTKSQVRFIMGTPLIQDSFHGNRWDYVYQLREAGKVKEQRRVILDFENELLKTVRGDVVPAGSEKAAAEPENTGTRVLAPNAKPQDKTMLNKLKFWDKEKAASPAAQKAKEQADKQISAPVELTPNGQMEQKVNDEPKSLLVVPVESMSLQGSVVAPAPADTPPAELEVAPVIANPMVEETQQPLNVPSALPKPAVPAQSVPYEPSSGMLFDKDLKFKTEESPPSAPTTKPLPRAGNVTPPEPKELPDENATGFFERMLEKIGF